MSKSPLTRFDIAFSRELLLWFANLPPLERTDVMAMKHRRFLEIRKRFPRLSPQEMDLAALLEICEARSSEEKAFASSRALTPEALARIARRRQAWAKSLSVRHSAAKSWLARNWGRVVNLRDSGASFRVIASSLAAGDRVRISHTTINHYWRLWGK